jgi:hypothetical protein
MGVLDPVCGFGPYVNQHNREGSRCRSEAWPELRTTPTWHVQVRTGRSVGGGVEHFARLPCLVLP